MSVFKGFTSVPVKAPKRSRFDLSHEKRINVSAGELVPILCKEALPGDTFEVSNEMLVRLMALLAPVFEQIRVYVHCFFVPNRLIVQNWENFIVNGRDGEEVFELPYVNVGTMLDPVGGEPLIFSKHTLSDYLGVPIFDAIETVDPEQAYDGDMLNIMPMLAYQKVYMDYYRDRNFVTDESIVLPAEGGDLTLSSMTPTDIATQYLSKRRRSYAQDYFTSALTNPQRGQEVMIPSTVNYMGVSEIYRDDTDALVAGSMTGGPAGPNLGKLFVGNDTFLGRIENIDTVGPLVNDLRSAIALQVWLEKNNIAGSRYTESLLIHFDVRPQDSRLQRSEYIGGGLVPVKISEVVSTAWAVDDADAAVPQGNMAGHGVAYGGSYKARYHVMEHGFVMCILSIMNPSSYHQGLEKMFVRRTFLDYPWPTFAKLGEQPVYDHEIYAAGGSFNYLDSEGALVENPVFGYQSQYADWKWTKSSNHGDFHDTLLYWTQTRDFANTPELGTDFLWYDVDDSSRIYATPMEYNILIYLFNRVYVSRPLPYFGVPNTFGFA